MTLYVDKSNGTPYVAFMDGNNSNYVSVEKASAGSWTNVGSAGFSGASPATSYLDNISLYTIGVTVFSAFSNGSYLQVWQNSGGSWSLVGGGSGVAAGSTAPSLAQNNGNIYVAFVDGTHSSGPSVMTYSGGTWNYVGLPAFTGSSCTYPSLLIIGGQAFLAFSDGAHSGKCSVYAYY